MDFDLDAGPARLARAIPQARRRDRCACRRDRPQRGISWDNVERLQAAGFFGMTIPRAWRRARPGLLRGNPRHRRNRQKPAASPRASSSRRTGNRRSDSAYGTEAQKQRAAALVLAGTSRRSASPRPEVRGSAATQWDSRADRCKDGFVINGKQLTGSRWRGVAASLSPCPLAPLMQSAGEEGIGGFLAYRDETKGSSIGARLAMGLRGLPETRYFEDMRVPDGRVGRPRRAAWRTDFRTDAGL